ncbi:MAG: shikimate dehydrogenase [Fimbriimonadaceae bacterium]|nr:shikimate dehydrogenase [Alphaproteobacteria bacterium]
MTGSPQAAPRAFVAGWPIAHSRSPLIHRYWLAQLGIAGTYDPVALAPNQAQAFFRGLPNPDQADGFVGGNVTIPHKQVAFSACDHVTAAAERLGSVNTLWIENGALYGDNTDGAGFTANLDQYAEGWDRHPGRAVVLGAGGAARAILVALSARGFGRISLVNRTLARAQEVARDLNLDLDIIPWERRGEALAGAGFLVNTTSLGMHGSPPLDLDLSGLSRDAIVTDLVYVPLQTDLLAAAGRLGLRSVDGLGMLLHQAVPGFVRWFKARPQVTDELRAHIIADLER